MAGNLPPFAQFFDNVLAVTDQPLIDTVLNNGVQGGLNPAFVPGEIVPALLGLPGPGRIIRPGPIIPGVVEVPDRIINFLPSRGSRVERLPGFQITPGAYNMDMAAAILLVVPDSRPGHPVLHPGKGHGFKVFQHGVYLFRRRLVFWCPGDHSRPVLELEVQGVGHGCGLVGITPQDLHVGPFLSGMILFPH
jgi:hypothetical protein